MRKRNQHQNPGSSPRPPVSVKHTRLRTGDPTLMSLHQSVSLSPPLFIKYLSRSASEESGSRGGYSRAGGSLAGPKVPPPALISASLRTADLYLSAPDGGFHRRPLDLWMSASGGAGGGGASHRPGLPQKQQLNQLPAV